MNKILEKLREFKRKNLTYLIVLSSVIGLFVLLSLPMDVIREKYLNNYNNYNNSMANANSIKDIKQSKKDEERLMLFEDIKDKENISNIYIGTTTTFSESFLVILGYKDGTEKEYALNSRLFEFFTKQLEQNLNLKDTKIIIGEKDEIIKKKAIADITRNKKAINDNIAGAKKNIPQENSITTLFFAKANSNMKSIGQFLAITFPFLIVFFMIYMMAFQMGLVNKDFDIINPEHINGSIDDLVGMEDIKKEVLQLKDIFNEREKYQSHDINHGFNIMFTGPAGVGKTKLASYLAKELNLPLLVGSAANLENGFVSGGANRLKGLYKTACRKKRAIIFLDEAEILFRRRGAGKLSKFEDDTANAFLALLDGVNKKNNAEVIWIVATNFDNANTEMDEAVLRRFQMKINFRLPNREERLNILKYFIGRKDPALIDENINLGYIADITTKISPAILKNITDTASMIAVSENIKVSTDLLMKALERHLVGLTDRKTTENLDEQRKVIAIHEMGHFLMHLDVELKKKSLELTFDNLLKIKDNIKVLKISTESVSKGGVLGFVLSKPEDKFIYTKKDLENQIRVYYGGVANEELFFGRDNISTGSYNDIIEVTKIIKHMVLDLEMFNDKKINYSMLTEKPSDLKLSQIETIAENNYKIAIESLKSHKDLTAHIVPILIEKYSLSIDDMLYEINSFLHKKESITKISPINMVHIEYNEKIIFV